VLPTQPHSPNTHTHTQTQHLQATAVAVESEPADEAAEDMTQSTDGGMGGDDGGVLSRTQILLRAGAMLSAGVALCAIFSDPLVESLTNLSR